MVGSQTDRKNRRLSRSSLLHMTTTTTTTMTTYQQQMKAVVRRVRDIDLWTFEGTPRAVLGHSLEPQVAAIVSDASAIAAAILGERRDHADGDVAFIAHVELRQRLVRLASLSANDSASMVIAECDSALRRVGKALCAVDHAVAAATGGQACLEYLSDLELSLRVRRAYATFRARVLARAAAFPDDARTEDVHARVIATGHEIANLVGLPVYPLLRMSDRLQLRSLQNKTVAWLRLRNESAREDWTTSGLRLWQDISATLLMFGQVNRRQELVSHDKSIILHVLSSLRSSSSSSSPPTSFTEDLWRDAVSLEGRDAEIDALIAKGERTPTSWQAVLERLDTELGGPRAAATGDDDDDTNTTSLAATRAA
jgi:hypothetical protein